MTSMPERYIPLSKTKNILLVLISLGFVAIGVWLITMPHVTWVSIVLGSTSAIFFGACGLVALKKLIDTQPGLIVNELGVKDNSSVASVGVIPWADVLDVQPSFVSGQKFVSLMMRDPEAYAERGNALQKRLARMNIKLVGTPVNISANTLKISFDELLELLHAYHRQSQKS
jgi:hypothetical protein